MPAPKIPDRLHNQTAFQPSKSTTRGFGSERLIPVEIDDHRGLLGFVQDNLPTILIWIAVVGFFVWIFVPQEIAALAERIEKLLGRKKRAPRH